MSNTWSPPGSATRSVHHIPQAELHQRLALDIADRLACAIKTRGYGVLSVSGGQSPIGLFEALRVMAIDWSCVRITLVDERCVPCTHPASNARLVQTHLLQGLAAQARLVSMVHATEEPLAAPQVYAQSAGAALRSAGLADVLVLGMGADGHTASLFPQAPNLTEALNRHNTHACMAIELALPPANAPYPRITQTLAQLLTARHIVLPITGTDKLQTLQQAFAGENPVLPVSYVLHQHQTPLALWLAN